MSVVEEVRSDREELARVLKKHAGIRRIVEDLYPDNAHFIYELLQNAEDKGATEVHFNLTREGLVFEHDGKPFSPDDIRGITNIGEGTKGEGDDKIGRFGVGFKSVFAYTETPEIWSPTFCFKIVDLVLPYVINPLSELGKWTRFHFPFNSPKKAKCKAYAEVITGLGELADTTLLFLSHIESIGWQIGPGETGEILRVSHADQHIEILKQTDGKATTSYHFLRFYDTVRGLETQNVAVAFPLDFLPNIQEFDASKPLAKQLKSIPATPGRVAVFFPAGKETSNLRFHLHAPFVPELSRASIKETPANLPLFQQLATLTAAALHQIKELGLLTVAVLNALPIRMKDFPEESRYFPIVIAVRDALKNSELLPADDETFVAARNAKLGRGAELRKLLGKDQLRSLYFPETAALMKAFEKELPDPQTKWATGEITEDRTPDLRTYLLNELGVEELDSDGFARKISKSFLTTQSDQWFISFYRYLSGQEALWRAPRWLGDNGVGVLRSTPILRLQDDTLEVPFWGDGQAKVYLPPPEGTDLPVVKRQIVGDEQAAAFLTRLGLKQPDIFVDIVERVLPKYARSPAISISSEEHAADIQKILRALASDSEGGKKNVIKVAQATPFIRAINLTGEIAFKKPTEIYRDTAELRLYFENAHDVWFVAEPASGVTPDDDAWDTLGVAHVPRRIMFSGELPTNMWEYSTRGQTVENYKLDGLENFLHVIQKVAEFDEQKRRSLVLWRYLVSHLRNNPRFFTGLYEWFYYSERSKRFDSYMLTQLRESEWIPTQDRMLKKPIEITMSGLCTECHDADELIRMLGISLDLATDENRKHAIAKELGFSDGDALERAKRFAALPLGEQEEFLADRERRRATELPDDEPSNLRAERVRALAVTAPERRTEGRTRSVSVNREMVKDEAKQYLLHRYTNRDGDLICQLCKTPMPFKRLDGTDYFEAVEFLPSLIRHHHQNYLALCAHHSAMFQVANSSTGSMRERFADITGNELEVELAHHDEKIYFTKTHIADLKTVIEHDLAQPDDVDHGPEPGDDGRTE